MSTAINTDSLSKRDLYAWQGAEGFIGHWFVCGFFPAGVEHAGDPCLLDAKQSAHWESDHLLPWGSESGIIDLPQQQAEAACDIQWMPVRTDEFDQKLNLSDARYNYPLLDQVLQDKAGEELQWYALAVLDVQAEQDVCLKFSVHDGTRLFHNGQLIFDQHSWHHVIYDEQCISIKLQAGRNTLLFKNERLAMVARLVDEHDNALEGVVNLAGADAYQREHNAAYALKKHMTSLTVEQPFLGSNAQELDKWQSEFRVDYERALGSSLRQTDNRAVKEIARTACDGYTRFDIQIPCEGDEYFDAAVLIPDDERRNGKTIITPHGHRFLFKHVIGVDPEPQPRWSQIGPYDANYNEQLAQAGFVTAAFAQRGFDNRNDVGEGHACNQFARMAESMGSTLPRLYIDDINRLADHMGGIDGVDANALGIAGLSGGATISWITAAQNTRFAAAAVFCGLMRARQWVRTGSCGMQIVPGIFPRADTGEILSLIAPRALLIGQGRLDATFNIIESGSMYEDAKRAWKAAGVEDKLQFSVVESGHQFHVPTAAAFFEKHL